MVKGLQLRGMGFITGYAMTTPSLLQRAGVQGSGPLWDRNPASCPQLCVVWAAVVKCQVVSWRPWKEGGREAWPQPLASQSEQQPTWGQEWEK